MKALYIAIVVAAVVTVRIAIYRLRKRRRGSAEAEAEAEHGDTGGPFERLISRIRIPFGDVGTIAMREIKERVRGRIFKIGTLLILVIVAAAIIIPKFHSGSSQSTQTIGVVGSLSHQARVLVEGAGAANGDSVNLVRVASSDAAKSELRAGKVDLVIVDESEVLVDRPAGAKGSSADPGLVTAVANYLGVVKAYRLGGLSPAQANLITNSKPVPIHNLRSGSRTAAQPASVIGLVLLFIMLTQYCTWILMGVMQEKSSRVVEVLLATVRSIELLGGKVLGIGLVALGQAALVVGFALALGDVTGSDVLHGSAPLVVLSELLWLVLGYAFYCWVYAAAGSTAERQDQVQTLALPLSLPILVGYIFSITVVSSGHADLFFKVLAYVPFTAPFCMSVLVGLNDVAWWQFGASVLITLAGTVAMAVFAARIYKRAVLRTGSRVRLRELISRRAH